MPRRRELTPQEALERHEHRREQSRLAMARLRATRRAVSQPVLAHETVLANTDTSLHAQANGHARARVPFPLVTSSPTEKRDTDTISGSVTEGDLAEVLAVLAPFGARGDVPTRRYLERLHQECPGVDLVAVAEEVSQWLHKPCNATRECNNAFLGRWVRKSAPRPPSGGVPGKPGNGRHPLIEHGARSAVGRVLEYALDHAPEVPSTWR